MDDLITWLKAQLDDDERDLAPLRQWVEFGVDHTQGRLAHMTGTTALMSARRALAEIDAKRRILDLHAPIPSHYTDGRFNWDAPGDLMCDYCASLCHSRSGLACGNPDAPWPCPTVRLLTLPYADRSGFNPKWPPADPDAMS